MLRQPAAWSIIRRLLTCVSLVVISHVVLLGALPHSKAAARSDGFRSESDRAGLLVSKRTENQSRLETDYELKQTIRTGMRTKPIEYELISSCPAWFCRIARLQPQDFPRKSPSESHPNLFLRLLLREPLTNLQSRIAYDLESLTYWSLYSLGFLTILNIWRIS